MQPPLVELKLRTFPLLHRSNHFVFTRKFLKVSTLGNHLLVEQHAEYEATLKLIW